MRDGETRDDAHARRNEEFIRQARRELEQMDAEAHGEGDGDLYPCAICGWRYDNRGDAMRCCSGDGEGGEPA